MTYRDAPKRENGAAPTKIVALMPAHNEADCVADTLAALKRQTAHVDRLVVVADNCTDDTAQIAAAAGAEVLVTQGNEDRKAGALNYALSTLLPGLDDEDFIFIQDADTIVVPEFISLARACMAADPRIVVSGRYACKAEHGLIGMLQRNEFARDGRRINRRRNRTHIMVGTSTFFPVRVLRHVSRARASGELPGHGFIYLTDSITEDFELTIAVKSLGYITMSPAGCDAITDVMNTVAKLWHQRIRWMRGGIEDLRRYGWSKVTRGFIFRQGVILFGIAALLLYVSVLLLSYFTIGSIHISRPWLMFSCVFVVDRVVQVRRAGKLAMLVSALMVVELVYDLFQQAVYVTAAYKAFRGSRAIWHET